MVPLNKRSPPECVDMQRPDASSGFHTKVSAAAHALLNANWKDFNLERSSSLQRLT
jgi:hypothetical protein